MKQLARYLVLLTVILFAIPTLAQDDPSLITLNDATPAIDVVITLPPDATGTVALDLANAAVTLRDAQGNVVFRSVDARIYALEINILPNTGSHTLTVERIQGVSQAFVAVKALPEVTVSGLTTVVPGTAIGLNQEASLALDNTHPGDTVSISIPAETIGVITATYFGTAATTQLVDSNGIVIAESTAGHVDGLNFVVADGEYQFTLLATNLNQPVVAGIRTLAAADGGFVNLAAQSAVTQAETVSESTASGCSATIAMSSVNLRSGPGTGYSVISYGYRGQEFMVGGRNNDNTWVVIGTPDGQSAWVSSSVAQFEGSCAGLTVFNVPTRDAQPAQIVIATQQPNVVYISAPASNVSAASSTVNNSNHEDDDDGEDEHEDEGDDD